MDSLVIRWKEFIGRPYSTERGSEKKMKERRKTLPAPATLALLQRGTSARSFESDSRTSSPLKVLTSSSSSILNVPSAQLATRVDYYGDARCSTSPLGTIDISEDVAPRFLLGSLVGTQCSSRESSSTPTYPFLPPTTADPTSVRNVFGDVVVKDPEALLDTQNLHVSDASRIDASIATALLTALGLLTSHSSDPKVAVFQLSAAAISFTLIALHSFHSRMLTDMEQRPRGPTLVQQLLKYFPLLIFASCWILFLLSITLTFPRAMSISVCLVVLASIPMVCGGRLPAALTLAIMTLFTLTLFALVFAVCVLPTEWLA